MIQRQLRFGASLATALTCLLSGCSEKSAPEAQTTTTEPSRAKSPDEAIRLISNTIRQASATNLATTTVVAAVAPRAAITNAIVASAVPTNATVATPSPTAQLLEQAKGLLAGQKYAEAASLLGSVEKESLNGQEKTLWQSLQAQVQKALAAQASKSATDSATKSIGGLLGK